MCRTVPSLVEVTGASTLGQLLLERSRSQRDDLRLLHSTDHRDSKDDSLVVCFGELAERARRGASVLARRGVTSGDRVLLLLPTGLDFLTVFFACQLLGAIPVPLVPPWSPERAASHIEQMRAIADRCRANLTVVSDRVHSVLSALDRNGALGSWLNNALPAEALDEGAVHDGAPPDDASRPAFLQFTSGSTGKPRGVVVSHANVLANAYGIGTACRFDRGDPIGCSWLPLFHDMGLVGHVIVPLLWNRRSILLPPEIFMRHPRSWLEAISRFGASVSTAPNFAYDLCAAKVKPKDVAHLDLSCWRIAMCGGEPVLASTLERFCQRFEPVGFRRDAFLPVYGLAESCLAVTLGSPGTPPQLDRVGRDELEQHGRAATSHDERPEATFVGVGTALVDHEVQVVDDVNVPCDDRVEGRIRVRGPSVATEYFDDEVSSRAAFQSGWLETGDRGYLVAGQLFVTGRQREIIIKAGRNLYPYDIEAAASGVDGVRAGRCAAFGVLDDQRGTEDLVVVCETRLGARARDELHRAVVSAVLHAVGVKPDDLVLVGPGTLSKTSSGKMRRGHARRLYLEGNLSTPRVDWGIRARLVLERARSRRRSRLAAARRHSKA